MAFQKAVTTNYATEYDANGAASHIAITGEIYDDRVPTPLVATCRIEGDALAALPADEAERFVAIQRVAAAFVKDAHAHWIAGLFPTIATKSPDEIAALPALTPDLLAVLTAPVVAPVAPAVSKPGV